MTSEQKENKKIHIACFGEVLWDVFPDNEKIGGAPLNVAVRLRSLDNQVALISRIGDDEKGSAIVRFLNQNEVDTTYIQIDEQLKTGAVDVFLDQSKSASYEIKHPRAWDNIQLTEEIIQLTKSADAFVFGSLITRSNPSRATLYELLKLAKFKILDLNLRPPHYTPDILIHLMNTADFIKCNDEEIIEVIHHFDGNVKANNIEEQILAMAKYTNTENICVTMGGNGAVLYYQRKFYYNSGYKIQVVDTVGAGDSFLASLINGLLNGHDPQFSLDYSNAVGALVASQEGATPEISETQINNLLKGVND